MRTASAAQMETVRKTTICSMIACMIALLFCLTCAPSTALADQKPLQAAPFDSSSLKAQSDDGQYFQNENYVIYFQGGKVGIEQYIGSATKVTIPEAVKLDGKFYPVVQIFSDAFSKTKVKTVSVPKTVVSIDSYAFNDCKSLTKVTGCKGLMHIGSHAFYKCSKLKSFPFGKKIEYIEAKAFSGSKVKTSSYPRSLVKDDSGNYVLRSSIVRVKGQERYTDAYKVLSLVNKERTKAGLRKLVMDEDLLKTAMQRAAEITVVFNHTRPNGESCYSADPSGKMYGENIARGQTSPAHVMYVWMNSPGHRANIMSENFKSIGIGCFKMNGNYYWVQTFGYYNADKASKPKNKTATHTVVRKQS